MLLRVPADEIRSSLSGALKIFVRDPKALSYFNPSPYGFWNSFQAIWIILIPYMISLLSQRLLLMGEHDLTFEEFPSAFFFSIKLLSITAEWLLLPFVLWCLANWLDIRQRYAIFIVARNWASVIMAWMFFVPTLAHLAGLIIIEVMIFTQFLLLGVVLVYSYRVARVTLEKPVGFCVALVAADFLFGVILGEALWSSIQASLTEAVGPTGQ